MNLCVRLTELCCKKAHGNHSMQNDPIIMLTAVCMQCLCMCGSTRLGVRLFMGACSFSHSVSTLVCKWKDRAILLAACLAPFPPSLCHTGSASEPLTEMLWRLLCHIGSVAGRLTDGQDRQEVRAGGWVAAKLQKTCVNLSLCALESTGRKKENVWLYGGAVSVNVHACSGGRRRRLQLFLFVGFYGL